MLDVKKIPARLCAKCGNVVDAKNGILVCSKCFMVCGVAKDKESTPTSHDAHYNKADKRFGIESMRILEGINCTGIPEEYWDICKRNLSLCLEMKYVLRLGEKDAPEKELDKASNFQHRARTGKFPWG